MSGGPFITKDDGFIDNGCFSIINGYASYIRYNVNANFTNSDFTFEYYNKIESFHDTSDGCLSLEASTIGNNYSLLTVGASSSSVNNNLRLFLSSNSSSWNIANGTEILNGLSKRWDHWAFSKVGTTIYVHKNGILNNSYAGVSSSLTQKGPYLYLGQNFNNASITDNTPRKIKFQHVRITKGVARYSSSNFSPPERFQTA